MLINNISLLNKGEYTVPVPSNNSFEPDFCEIIKDQYKHQPIILADWPPRVGQDFFGRLALLETKDKDILSPKTLLQKQWHILRGEIDQIPCTTNDKEIDIQDILKPNNSGQSLRVVIDGPPGIGKTTLCRKLLNMWANGKLTHGRFELALYCPLRNETVAQARTLEDLSVYESPKVSKVVEWMKAREGEGLLLIFDGWDELSTDLRQSSLPSRIIRKNTLAKCTVIVTSRSYASSSLLEISSIDRHIEVLGFFENEIKEVIKGTLDKECHLAERLIKDLEIRSDVLSLCYVPLVCSLVILVYCKSDGQLPVTVTELYENFILQTIRRHVKTKSTHKIEPRRLHSLNDLPSVLNVPFQELCQFAYLNLKENKLTFTSHQLDQSLQNVVNEDYLGLMTMFNIFDDERYQFIHLTIQEFLAAWWIANVYEKTEEIFAEHFANDYFRMCMKFVAGLSHLKHDSYQQYFDKSVDLQCSKRPLFGSEVLYHSHFNRDLDINRPHIIPRFCYFVEKFDFFIFHILQESQNKDLCQVLSKAMKNHSLCLFHDQETFSQFDKLCLGFFLKNSKRTWNCLHLKEITKQTTPTLINALTTGNSQCKIFEAEMNYDLKLVVELFQSSFPRSLQHCLITLESCSSLSDISLIFLELIKLQYLKVLHLKFDVPSHPDKHKIQWTNEKTVCELENNTALHELSVHIVNIEKLSFNIDNIALFINSVIRGVTKNKSIKTFTCIWQPSVKVDIEKESPVFSDTIYHLLRDNCTLQALKLDLPGNASSMKSLQVNTPLSALEIRMPYQLVLLNLLHIKGLDCLIFGQPNLENQLLSTKYIEDVSFFFNSHSNLQQLELLLSTAQMAENLFCNLQGNTTLKALKVWIEDTTIFESIGPSIQGMLSLNKVIKYLEIQLVPNNSPLALLDYIKPFNMSTGCITNAYIFFLASGLSYNTSLQGLCIPILLSLDNNEVIIRLFNNISNIKKLIDLKVHFFWQHKILGISRLKPLLFYEYGLTCITNALISCRNIKHLQITCNYFDQPCRTLLNVSFGYADDFLYYKWSVLSHYFWRTCCLHPSLQYIEFNNHLLPNASILMTTFEILKKAMCDILNKQNKKEMLINWNPHSQFWS